MVYRDIHQIDWNRSKVSAPPLQVSSPVRGLMNYSWVQTCACIIHNTCQYMRKLETVHCDMCTSFCLASASAFASLSSFTRSCDYHTCIMWSYVYTHIRQGRCISLQKLPLVMQTWDVSNNESYYNRAHIVQAYTPPLLIILHDVSRSFHMHTVISLPSSLPPHVYISLTWIPIYLSYPLSLLPSSPPPPPPPPPLTWISLCENLHCLLADVLQSS